MSLPPPSRPVIRAVRDTDGDGLAALIAACFAEYPGCIFDRAREFPELDAIASHFRALGGALWIATADDGAGRSEIVGSLGLVPAPPAAVELVKVYVARDRRGQGLARALLAEALADARARGVQRIELWSDTRFARGHAFYEKEGFQRTGERRFLADLSDTWECRFIRELAPER